ncbi:MAG TPA: DUF4349 domain-containing protein [Solirubrobacteraceae bacterium]|nr:DUF4349 domain-containing protein [Solirubrobacteraceae bacterium]
MQSAEPLEPEVLAALEAIDATLHGEPVDPEHAELAELALILRDERPVPTDAFLARLDRRVQDRFAAPARRTRSWSWSLSAHWRASATALTALAALIVAVVIVSGRSHPVVNGLTVGPSRPTVGYSSSSGAGSGGAGSSAGATSSSGAASSAAAPHSPASAAPKSLSAAPAPREGHGRDLTQSARLGLQARAGQIAPVAQEVFNVIGAEHGVVLSSHVTQATGAPGYATFSLQVPTGRLETTLNRLSRLRHSRVTMREDASADITSHVDNTAAALAALQAQRRSLLRQLAATDVTAQADRLQREAARALAQIDRDQSELQRLRHRVADSTISVTVQAPPIVHHQHHATGGFTFSRALHDAGHILLVAAGVALIALAVLVPLGLVVVLCAWVWSLVLRRRREGALGPS